MTSPAQSEGESQLRLGPLKTVLFALVPVTILVLLLEFVATLTIERHANIVTVSEIGAREYQMRIGKWPWSRGVITPINSDGFPDAELPVESATKACMHVVMIGDSFVLGDGVDGDSSFTSIVSRELAVRPGARCVRTFNLGERGSTIPRQARRLRELRARLKPDLVLLGQYQNDLTDLLDPEPRDLGRAAMAADSLHRMTATTRRGLTAGSSQQEEWGVVAERFSFLNPRLVRLLAYHAFGVLITSGVHRDELRHWSVLADTARRDEAARLMARYTLSYDSLATELARDSIAFGVIILPSKFDVLAGRFPEEEFFLRLAEKHGVPALRIFPVLDANRSPYAFLMYDGHLNEHGNRLVAGAVSDWLLLQDPAPFPALRLMSRD